MKTFTTKGNFGRFYFVDEKGKAGRPYYFASDYKYGFAKVQETQLSKPQYIDLLGRISDIPTASGNAFYHFSAKQTSLQRINTIFFADEIFCKGIKEEIVAHEKERVVAQFNSGCIAYKQEVQANIKKQFDYVDKARLEALNMIENQLKTEQAQKQKELAMKKAQLERQQTIKKKYNEVVDYLESL